MKKKSKQLLTRLAVVLFTLMALFGFGIAVMADEGASGGGYVAQNGYVYRFDKNSGIELYPQFSNYVPTVSYDKIDHWGYSIIFGLHDEYNNKTFEKLYCMDMPVDTD